MPPSPASPRKPQRLQFQRRQAGAAVIPSDGPRLGDYRRYLQLALAARNAEGQLVRFTTADGDAQLAYYVVIAASFAPTVIYIS